MNMINKMRPILETLILNLSHLEIYFRFQSLVIKDTCLHSQLAEKSIQVLMDKDLKIYNCTDYHRDF